MESRRKIIQKQLISEPEDVFLNYALGLEFFSEKNFVEAKKQFEKTLSIDKNYLGAYYQLGKTFEALEKIEEALKTFKDGLFSSINQKNFKAKNEFEEAIFLLE